MRGTLSTDHTHINTMEPRESGQEPDDEGGQLGTGRGGKEGWKRLPICGERGKGRHRLGAVALACPVPQRLLLVNSNGKDARDQKKTKVQRERGKHPFVPPFQKPP